MTISEPLRLVVAVVGRAHGLRGEVAVDVRTDSPEERLTVGASFPTEPARPEPLVVERVRRQSGRWLLAFAGVADRDAAEALRGVRLLVEVSTSEEEDAWYPQELDGLRAELRDGTVVGIVRGLEHLPAHDALVVEEPIGDQPVRTLVPFVRQIVPVVDVAGGRVVLDPPGGLLARDEDALEVDRPEGRD